MTILMAGTAALAAYHPQAKNVDDAAVRVREIPRFLGSTASLAGLAIRHLQGRPLTLPPATTDFAGTLAAYGAAGNGIFVPEARPDPGLAFIAIGAYRAMGFHPFGVEDVLDSDELFSAFSALQSMTRIITDAQAAGRIHGFRLVTGEHEEVELGDYTVTISGPFDTRGMFGVGTGEAAEALTGYGLVLHLAEDEFLVLARGASLRFSLADSIAELDTVTEGEFLDDQWVSGRILNGDERYFMFPKDGLRTVRIELLRRATRS